MHTLVTNGHLWSWSPKLEGRIKYFAIGFGKIIYSLVPSLCEIGDLSCITSCLVLPNLRGRRQRGGKGEKKQRAKRVSVREGDAPYSSPPNSPAVVLTLSLPFYGLPRRLGSAWFPHGHTLTAW